MPIARTRTGTPTRPSAPAPGPRGVSMAAARTGPRRHVLSVPYAHRAIASQAGATWDKALRATVYVGERLPDALRPYAAPRYSWEGLQDDIVNGVVRGPSVPTRAVVPHAHQVECARVIGNAVAKGRTSFLVADDVGLGKTIGTWLSIQSSLADEETVLVVCPVAAIAHWRRTIEWMGDDGRRVVVINYERLKSLFEVPEGVMAGSRTRARRGKRVRTLKGVARFGEPMAFDVVVWDEAHRLRNLSSARSKFALRIYEVSDYTFWLSATAGQTPLELGYLYPMMMESTGARKSALMEWETWCRDQGIGVRKGDFGKWVWDPRDGDEDLRKVHALLFGGEVVTGLRRSPTDIAGWPAVSRVLLPVALGADDRAHYDMAWGEFRRALELAAARGGDSEAWLVAALRFRQKASLLRTGQTVDLVTELLSQGQQVAVSVAFVETLEVLREAFEGSGRKVAVIRGSLSPPEKEANRLDFQHGRADVCLYTVTEAISLHQGEYPGGERVRSNVVHDVRWSAIDMKQVEGRTHRDGRFSQVYWCAGEDTVEEGIVEVVAGRLRSMSTMQGDRETVGAIEAMLREAR